MNTVVEPERQRGIAMNLNARLEPFALPRRWRGRTAVLLLVTLVSAC
jgi:hypothetical protein